jgi:photosystem II stability/assembly factor-like uncharacterized protein
VRERTVRQYQGSCIWLLLLTVFPLSGWASVSSGATPATNQRLTAIAFFDPSTGYGVFTTQGGGRCQDFVGQTADGGAKFGNLVSATSWSCANAAPTQSLAFDDHGDGFLYGPDLVVTHDGGKSWTPSGQPGAVLSVQELGRSVWMIESDCSSPTAQVCPLRLEESTDGGWTWSSSLAPPGAVDDPGASGGADQAWLDRITQSVAYMLSSSPSPSGKGVGETPLWFTTNGGMSWSRRAIPCGVPASNSVALSAAPDGKLMAICAGEPGAGNEAKTAMRSTNDGVTWSVLSACSGAACNADTLTPGYLGGIVATSPVTAFLYGSRSSLLVTHDGGRVWRAVEPRIGDSSGGTEQAIFFDRSDGVVLGENGNDDDLSTLWRTSDGGEKWTALVPQTDRRERAENGAAAGSTIRDCSTKDLRLSAVPGLMGMGNVSSVLLAENTGSSACRLTGYPAIQLLNSQGDHEAQADETPLASAGGTSTGAALPSLELKQGEVASAAIDGFDRPTSDTTTCPSYPAFAVTLSGQPGSVTVHYRIGSCSGLSVHPFVLGFNGTDLTGEASGITPRCSSASDVVMINAFSGAHLVTGIGSFPGRSGGRLYQLVLEPGRYEIRSGAERARHVTVFAGRVAHLGRYGACVSTRIDRVTPRWPTPTTSTPRAG